MEIKIIEETDIFCNIFLNSLMYHPQKTKETQKYYLALKKYY